MNIERLKEIYSAAGAEWSEINIFGIRNPEGQADDLFNDQIGIAAGDVVKLYQGTTDPGTWWTKNPISAAGYRGAAHLCEGFHKNGWKVGIHAQGSAFAHQALVHGKRVIAQPG